ncbi:MAG: DUF4328 domain-containing protein [Polyangiaceae bacterium]
MDPRDHHFFFAKKMIPTHVFRSPDKMFTELTGPRRDAFLMFLWTEAGRGMPEQVRAADVGRLPGRAHDEVLKLDVVGALRQGGYEVIVISMPPARAANEAVFIALARGAGRVRVFFIERCRDVAGTLSENDVVVAEVSAEGGRANHGFHTGDALETLKQQVGRILEISFAGLETSLPPVAMSDFMAAARASPGGQRSEASGMGDILEKMVLVRAGLPVFFWLVGAVLPVIGYAARVLNPLLSFAIFVVLLLWTHKLYTIHRAKTQYSPGMAVGGWFIPLANIVFPPLILRDLWKAVRGPEGSAVIFLWWFFWLGEIFFRALYASGFAVYTYGSGASRETMLHFAGESYPLPSALGPVLTWGVSLTSLLVGIAAHGLLWHIVRRIRERA